MKRTAVVFGSIRILFKENKGYIQALSHYLNGLVYMSKNDALGDFESCIFMSFVEAFKSFMRASGDWAGKEKFMDVLLRLLVDLHLNIPDFVEIGQIMVRPGKKILATVNLERAAKLKIMCDLYFLKRFMMTYEQFNDERMLLVAILSKILEKKNA